MNYICCADLHIRSKRPQYRCDDYFKTVCWKFRQIIYLCNKYECDLIVAGDFFDSIRVGHKVVNAILNILKKLKGKCLVVAGQHDQVYHSKELEGSPLFTLIISGKVMLLNREDYYFDGVNNIYGCSFGEEPVENPEPNSILVIHKSITLNEPPFFLIDAISSKEAFKKYRNYDFIISGDYHAPFSVFDEVNSTALINCGPMLRQSIDQMSLKPVVWLINELGIKPIKLKIEPPESIFAITQIKQKEESSFSKSIGELVESLKESSNRPDYKGTVELLMNEAKVSDATRNRANEIMGSISDGTK